MATANFYEYMLCIHYNYVTYVLCTIIGLHPYTIGVHHPLVINPKGKTP